MDAIIGNYQPPSSSIIAHDDFDVRSRQLVRQLIRRRRDSQARVWITANLLPNAESVASASRIRSEIYHFSALIPEDERRESTIQVTIELAHIDNLADVYRTLIPTKRSSSEHLRLEHVLYLGSRYVISLRRVPPTLRNILKLHLDDLHNEAVELGKFLRLNGISAPPYPERYVDRPLSRKRVSSNTLTSEDDEHDIDEI